MPTATFQFGEHLEHECQAIFSYLGYENYYVDGTLVHKHWSLNRSGVREFTASGYQLKVDVAINSKRVDAKVFINDKLVSNDLFVDFNSKLIDMRTNPPILVKALLWIVVALFFIGVSIVYKATS